LTHIRQTLLLTSSTLSVIRVLAHMTLVCSIAHMYLYRWYVPLARTPSSLRSALRPVTEWLLTHSLRVWLKATVFWPPMLTPTTEELRFLTWC